MASPAKIYDIIGKCLYGMLYGFGVSLYHVSACMFGCQQTVFVLGPKVIVLPTSHAHKLADITNRICILNLFVIGRAAI